MISIAAIMDTGNSVLFYKEDGSIITLRRDLYPADALNRVVSEISARISNGNVAVVKKGALTPVGIISSMLGKGLRLFGVKPDRIEAVMRGKVALRVNGDILRALELNATEDKNAKVVIASRRAAMRVPEDLLTNGLLSDPEAVDAFLVKMAEVAHRRNHTAGELLAFLERGNCCALTKEGDILCYKVLGEKDGPHGMRYVDLHSRTVPQDVGVVVRKDEADVDADRARECSFGLHVGKLGYTCRFSPLSPTALVRVDPRDVIAVPVAEDATKMRTCRYRILSIISNDLRDRAVDFYARRPSDSRLSADLREALMLHAREVVAKADAEALGDGRCKRRQDSDRAEPHRASRAGRGHPRGPHRAGHRGGRGGPHQRGGGRAQVRHSAHHAAASHPARRCLKGRLSATGIRTRRRCALRHIAFLCAM